MLEALIPKVRVAERLSLEDRFLVVRGDLALLSQLLRWRVGARWYVAALLPAPVLAAAVLFALSLTSPIFTAENKAAILLAGITAGLTTVQEAAGWTGFAVPRLPAASRCRGDRAHRGYGVGSVAPAAGLWVGGTYAGSLPLAVFVASSFFAAVAQLTAYRVLMVRVYDRTESLLVATLMHASLTASTIFIFTPVATGASFLIYTSALAGAMGIVVGAVALANSGQLSRRPVQQRMG